MFKPLTIPALAMFTMLAGCGYYATEEAGSFINQGDLGRATLNNQVKHTCREVTAADTGKYGNPVAANCPGRRQDGKYALYAYRGTVRSAAEPHSASLKENAIVD